jgi:hypothetical protein
MLLPPAPEHMHVLRGQTVYRFGYDTESGTRYTFNSLGYRADQEFVDPGAIVVLGNTLSFGLGIDIGYTYSSLIQERTGRPVYNFAWGCYAHTNLELSHLLESLLKHMTPSLILFQINNLNRLRIEGTICFDNEHNTVQSEYHKFLEHASLILNNCPHMFLHWDDEQHQVDLPPCLIYNKYHVDSSLKSHKKIFGRKSHRLIAEKILSEIK